MEDQPSLYLDGVEDHMLMQGHPMTYATIWRTGLGGPCVSLRVWPKSAMRTCERITGLLSLVFTMQYYRLGST
jgi:hypothetical protein